jgi:hypothetical protein
MSNLKQDAPSRSVTDVGAGDYVKIGSSWKRISSNSAEGAARVPKSWSVTTEDGETYSMWDVNRYAKREDLE